MSRAVEVPEAEARRLFDTGYPVSAACDGGYTRQLFSSVATGNYGVRTFADLSTFAVSRGVPAHTVEDVRYYRRYGTKTNDDVAGAILRREGGAHNARRTLTTEWHSWESAEYPELGDLPHAQCTTLRNAVESARATRDDVFIIRSYGTPIAWIVRNAVTMPRLRYSLTTTQHQLGIVHALKLEGWYADERAHPERRGKTPYTTSWQTRAYG